jgi:hypothetical protein
VVGSQGHLSHAPNPSCSSNIKDESWKVDDFGREKETKNSSRETKNSDGGRQIVRN